MTSARPPSLLRGLAQDLVIAHLVSVVVILLLMVQVLRITVDTLEARDLREVANDIVAQIGTDADGRPSLHLPPEMAARFSPSYGRYAFAVLDEKGRGIVTSEGDTEPLMRFDPISAPSIAPFQTPHESALLYGVTVRGLAGTTPIWVQVAEDMNHRDVLMDEVVDAFLVRALWALVPLFVILVLVALVRMKRRLAPLLHASDMASHIGPQATQIRLPEESMPVEIRPLLAAVNSALSRLDHAFMGQKEFLENAAHELRTPLAVLRTRVETMLDPAARGLLIDDIAIITRTVTQLLRVAELEGIGSQIQEPVDLAVLARAVASYLGPVALANGKTVVVAGADYLPMTGNAEALGQAINNLVENGLSHTAPGTAVEITLMAQPGPTVQVRDHGPGVAPHERDVIFQRFWRSNRRNGSGAGLGLSIVSRAVHLHHGTVGVADAPGGGALFTITFPPAG